MSQSPQQPPRHPPVSHRRIETRPMPSVPRDASPRAQSNYTDKQRGEFLQKLDASTKVTLWGFYLEFVESNLDCAAFTEPQREVIDEMISKFGERIGW